MGSDRYKDIQLPQLRSFCLDWIDMVRALVQARLDLYLLDRRKRIVSRFITPLLHVL